MKKIIFLGIIFLVGLAGLQPVYAAESPIRLTPGITLEKKNTLISNKKQAINLLNINLLDPYTTMNYGVSDPINKLEPVTAMAKMNTFEKHHIVGAINASFFHMENGNPTYLLSSNNNIQFLGAVSNLENGYMYTPAAFGVDKNGKALIDKFKLKITFGHHNKTFQVDSFNRQRNTNESILYTSSFRYGNTRTNETGLEIIVRNLNKTLDPGADFGETVTGKVTGIRPYGQVSSSIIPEDGFVISAHGTKADQIRDLKIGDSVTVKADIDDKWRDASFMLASGPLLVQKGKVNMTIDPSSPRAVSREPRTAVAVDSTRNKVFFVTVDGRMPGYSEGMTLKEFAAYLVSLGADQALNLDGGGSTTMAARLPGNRYASLVNKPSGGKQRNVSAVLQAISTAPYGEAVSFKAAQSVEGKLAVGASVSFTLSAALDRYNNLIPVHQDQVKYKAEGAAGKMEGDRFIALKEGTANVTIQYGEAEVKVPVTVSGTPHKIEVNPKELYLGKGDKQKLTVKAYDSSGKPLIINSSNIEWSSSGEIGEVGADGVFQAAAKEAKGTLTGRIGGAKAVILVTVSNKPKIISSFDSAVEWKAEGIRARTSLSSHTNFGHKEGKGTLKLTYDFEGNKNGTAASYAVASQRLLIPGKPSAIGIWVYGDGQAHWLRGKLYDASGKEVTINFTEDGALNWKGWRYIEADIPSSASYPISLDRIYIAEPRVANQNKGSIYLDKLQAVYDEDHIEPYFQTNSSTIKASANKQWKIAFNIEMSPSTVNSGNIYVQDEAGERLPVSVKLNKDLKTVMIGAPSKGYASGKSYQLVVTTFVRSAKGIPLRKDYSMPFGIY